MRSEVGIDGSMNSNAAASPQLHTAASQEAAIQLQSGALFDSTDMCAALAQLVEQFIRNQDSDALTTEAEAKHGKAFGPPAVRQ